MQTVQNNQETPHAFDSQHEEATESQVRWFSATFYHRTPITLSHGNSSAAAEPENLGDSIANFKLCVAHCLFRCENVRAGILVGVRVLCAFRTVKRTDLEQKFEEK